ncbi:protein kinase-like domain, concanavalin A-like lectin/glucanase domain protein [Tanacetum coccineum]
MRELREDTFSGNKNDDAYEHVERVLDNVSLFNILGVSHDTVMPHVFPITLTRAAKRWVDRLSPGTVDSWDLLKKAFIQRYCPSSKTAKQLEEICNFKQEGRDMKKLKENVHAIQVGCQLCRGAHLDKECSLNSSQTTAETTVGLIEEYRDTTSHHQDFLITKDKKLTNQECEVGEVYSPGSRNVLEETGSIQIKKRIQAARNRQKSYADLKYKPMDFKLEIELCSRFRHGKE